MSIPQTEDEAFRYAKACILARNEGGPTVDEFMSWWNDPWIRRQIHKQAARWSFHREDYQELWQAAWLGVAMARPDSTVDMIWRVNDCGRPVAGIAYNFMQKEYRRKKKYRQHEQTFAETDGIEKMTF